MTLTIISHTEHYLNADGTVVGLASTVSEINELLALFDHINHIAMLHDAEPPANTLSYKSNSITFVPLPAVGGPSLMDKLAILQQIPHVTSVLNKHLKSSDVFQFRAPTGIGVFLIPYLICCSKNRGWFKYAGNWKQTNAPWSYRFQKWLLERQGRKVTINGFWENQPAHCLSFENPCLTQEEVQDGQFCTEHKKIKPPYNFCFVGRLEAAKGVDILLTAFMNLEAHERLKIGMIHLVGNGSQMDYYKKKIKTSDLQFTFHGLLSRMNVQEIYKQCHAIVLPSVSEGFPKVVSEAMNYGCVPIVSDVSALGHYIQHYENGFLINQINVDGLSAILKDFLSVNPNILKTMLQTNKNLSNRFTYTHYMEALKLKILDKLDE